LAADDLHVIASRQLTGRIGRASIAVLPDGRLVVAYGTGQAAVLTPNLEVTWRTPDLNVAYVFGVHPVPGTSQVLVATDLKAITLDVADQIVLANDRWGGAGSIVSAAASADGHHFATFDQFVDQLTVWAIDPTQLRRRVCALVGRDLTPEEWRRHISDTIPYQPVCG
jgi:hypothetical protein